MARQDLKGPRTPKNTNPANHNPGLGFLALAAIALAGVTHIYGWSSDGHQTVGAIADSLIAGHRAAQQVATILGKAQNKQLTLSTVAVWADCARNVQPDKGFIYDPGQFKELACAIFEDDPGKAAMIDYAKRNNSNCKYDGKNQDCHKAFHFANIPIELPGYTPTEFGATNYDVVHAVDAAIAVLQGKPAPAPFNFASQKEALILLVHFTGDLHQPLHVAAMYLDSTGKIIDPTKGTFDPKTDTHGGNSVGSESTNLHHTWDETKYLTSGAAPAAMVSGAKALKVGTVDLLKSPAAWATDTVMVAENKSFKGLSTSALSGGFWPMKVDAAYTATRTQTQSDQVTKGGARLAAILTALWPDPKKP
jgi:hypothetical protein